MKKICDLPLETYKCVTVELTTTEVVLTDERVQHIKDHHPGDFERYSGYLQEVIQQPDYILADERPSTAMVLKQISQEKGARIRLALRLAAPADGRNYANSVLTFMRIREKEWKRLLRNKKILYKFE